MDPRDPPPRQLASAAGRGSAVIPNLAQLRFADVADVAIVAVLLWMLIVWIRTTRARLAFLGLAILGVLYLVAQQLDLQLTTWLFQGFFAAVVLVMIVVFQDDLRRLFERIAVAGLGRRQPRAGRSVIDVLVRSCTRLAQHRTGALVVLPGRDPLDRHLEGGITLRGAVSEPLLLSLFDPHSPGHDGAVLIEGNEVARFAVHLPLSVDSEAVGPGGTRHLAALGLAERSDAVCIAVSEERGTISLAHQGRIRVVDPAALGEALGRFRRGPRAAPDGRWRAILRAIPLTWREGLAAVVLAAALWLVLVPGDAVVEVELGVPVEIENLPAGFTLESVEPAEVLVSVTGRRRDLVLARREELHVRIDALLVQLGRRTFEVRPDAVVHPDGMKIRGVSPDRVRLSVVRDEDEPAP